MTRARQSAGILVYRRRGGAIEVLLAHPGGPYFRGKDDGAWSIPKGEFDDEAPLAAARREFLEETGVAIDGDFVALAPQRLRSGKLVHAFAIERDLAAAELRSNSFEMEWPPRSGRRQSFPEIDRYDWFTLDAAARKINAAQRAFLDELAATL